MQTCCSGSCSWQFWLFWLFYGKCIQERRTWWEWKTSGLEIWYLEVLLLPLLSQSAWQFWLMQLWIISTTESGLDLAELFSVSNVWCFIVVWTKYWINSTYKAVKILSKSKSEEIKIVSIKITGNNSKMIKYFIYRTFI